MVNFSEVDHFFQQRNVYSESLQQGLVTLLDIEVYARGERRFFLFESLLELGVLQVPLRYGNDAEEVYCSFVEFTGE